MKNNFETSQKLCLDSDGGLPRLLEIMARLRDPETGCPWDIAQTFETIVPYTIEEAYEVANAIAEGDHAGLEGELGDLLLQVIYYTQMGSEKSLFDFASVTKAISDKMVHRHPHVFGSENRDKSTEQQTRDWEQIKAAERSQKGALDGVAMALPALTRALKLQKRAARVGFDWPSTDQVIDKIAEEAAELSVARQNVSAAEIEEEFGDLLFVMANLARHLKIDPEAALRSANTKFTLRFQAIESELDKQGRSPEQSNLEEMDAIWNKVKAAKKSPTSLIRY